METDERFAFGANWRRYLEHLTEQEIEEAISAMQALLGVSTLEGKRFLDSGSGSGLHSLVAWRLGADVVSYDYDPESVACTEGLRDRCAPGTDRWRVMRGDALGEAFHSQLGAFDVVYSWGVLHHTGDMWRAIDIVSRCVASGGVFALALYNDQGAWSARWTAIKRRYNESGDVGRRAILYGTAAAFALRKYGKRLLPYGRVAAPGATPGQPGRGMRRMTDLRDWVGGYPFEVASPAAVFAFLRERGFTLESLTTVAGEHGNNEFVFRRSD